MFNFTRLFESKNSTASAGRILDCYWDFEINPISYDIIWMLSAASLFAQLHGYESIRVNFIPENDPQSRNYPQKYLSVISREALEWRRRNICYQAPSLFPAVSEVLYWPARDYTGAYWNKSPITGNAVGYHWLYYKYVNANLSPLIRTLVPSKISHQYIGQWADEKRISLDKSLVLTLREHDVDPMRNNNMSTLEEFVRTIRRDFEHILIVRDTERTELPKYFMGFPTCDVATYNIELRAALYESARLNVAVSSGPAALLQLNSNTNFIVSKFIHKDVAHAEEGFMLMKGFDLSRCPSFLSARQKWVWGADSSENLCKAYGEIKWE